MTTENTGSHDPDYNISVSSVPDKIREEYAPPVGSNAANSYNPNVNYPPDAWERAMDNPGGGPDPDYIWPNNPPDRDSLLMHKVSEWLVKINEQQMRDSETINAIHKLLSDHIDDQKPTA